MRMMHYNTGRYRCRRISAALGRGGVSGLLNTQCRNSQVTAEPSMPASDARPRFAVDTLAEVFSRFLDGRRAHHAGATSLISVRCDCFWPDDAHDDAFGQPHAPTIML